MNAAMCGFEESSTKDFLFTFEDFERMEEAGLFDRVDRRVELLEGRFFSMAAATAEHARITAALIVALSAALGRGSGRDDILVATHGTLRIGERNAPEPDLMIVRRTERRYHEGSDALLVVEVSLSTQDNDLRVKPGIYAGAGIPEYWVVDLESRVLRVLRSPVDGAYRHEAIVGEDGEVSPIFAPELKIMLRDIF